MCVRCMSKHGWMCALWRLEENIKGLILSFHINVTNSMSGIYKVFLQIKKKKIQQKHKNQN